MKLGSFRMAGRDTFGVVRNDGIVDLGKRLGARCADLRDLIGLDGGLELARLAAAEAESADGALDAVEYLPVIPNPSKIFCIGVNYADHLEEVKMRKAAYPTVFLRCAASQAAHGQPLLHPHESQQFDFEGEVALVIGKEGRRIRPEDSWNHIAGYACYNDGSVRDWQFHTSQWGPGKNFAATGAFGPWMTTADELDLRSRPIELTTRLNGQVVQRSDTSHLIFTVPELVAYCSTILPLCPGDVIVTGTPGGVGMAREPRLFMLPGDRVEVELSGVGVLCNTVALG